MSNTIKAFKNVCKVPGCGRKAYVFAPVSIDGKPATQHRVCQVHLDKVIEDLSAIVSQMDESIRATKLSDEYNGSCHAIYDPEDWRNEVASGDTCRGYWEWVVAQIESNGDDVKE